MKGKSEQGRAALRYGVLAGLLSVAGMGAALADYPDKSISTTGTAQVAKARLDGYTILYASSQAELYP